MSIICLQTTLTAEGINYRSPESWRLRLKNRVK